MRSILNLHHYKPFSMLVTSNTLWLLRKWASSVIWIMSDNHTQQINVEKDIWNYRVACQIENLKSQQRNNEEPIRGNLVIGEKLTSLGSSKSKLASPSAHQISFLCPQRSIVKHGIFSSGWDSRLIQVNRHHLKWLE